MNKFQFWSRYVSRLLRINAVYKGEFIGWKVEAFNENSPTAKDFEQCEKRQYPLWRYSEQYPWNIANRLSKFPFTDIDWTVMYPNGKHYKTQLKFQEDKQMIFKGDRVKVLVGPDKGKNGVVSSLIRVRDLLYVDGLNYMYLSPYENTFSMRLTELPLNSKTEVCLIDPQDNQPCEVEWRYDEQGKRVRVSTRSGRIIPTSIQADALDDGVIPSLSPIGNKDTHEDDLVAVTYTPTLRTFSEDILSQQINTDSRVRKKTFWY